MSRRRFVLAGRELGAGLAHSGLLRGEVDRGVNRVRCEVPIGLAAAGCARIAAEAFAMLARLSRMLVQPRHEVGLTVEDHRALRRPVAGGAGAGCPLPREYTPWLPLVSHSSPVVERKGAGRTEVVP